MAHFSVVIPVLNGAEFLGEALASIETQTLENIRVLVSDNASTDSTPDVLAAWRDRLDLRVIRQTRTLPMLAHFNAILEEIDSERYMLLCHDDYLADPEALRLANSALDQHPGISAVYCDLIYVSSKRHQLATRRFRRKSVFGADEAGCETIRTARNMFGIPLAVRTAALRGLRYDPQFNYLADVDLSWAIARGQDLLHVPRPMIANRYRGDNTTWTLLDRCTDEYLALTQKYDVQLGPLGRTRLAARIWRVNQQRKLFGAYGRMVEWRC